MNYQNSKEFEIKRKITARVASELEMLKNTIIKNECPGMDPIFNLKKNSPLDKNEEFKSIYYIKDKK